VKEKEVNRRKVCVALREDWRPSEETTVAVVLFHCALGLWMNETGLLISSHRRILKHVSSALQNQQFL
jgi:hypothetical protein